MTAQCHFRNNWQRQDLNPGPRGPKPDALLTELSRPAFRLLYVHLAKKKKKKKKKKKNATAGTCSVESNNRETIAAVEANNDIIVSKTN